MRLGRTALWTLLANNAAELRFRRRINKPGFKDYRRMLCTIDKRLLLSAPGKQILNYTVPNGSLRYDPAAKNLVVCWDIFMQNWRMVNCDDVDVIAVIKTSPDPTDFWKYFFERLADMSAAQKARFMNT
ncbi:MAG: hypothetical protein RL709_672 [Pseudomonadota bacterium]|jgi:hypothetical protein